MYEITHFIRDNIHSISTAIVTTLLVIFGSDINRWVKKQIKKYHFIVRLTVFVIVCAVGYGMATLLLAKIVAQMLGGVGDSYLLIVVAVIFFLLGLAAEERKQI